MKLRMPLASRILFTITAVLLPVGAHMADFFSNSHIYNPTWPPHAKFHGGQTLMFSIFLGLLTVLFAWRRSQDKTSAVLATSAFAGIYWVTQALAGIYPGTAAIDPEFVTADSYPLGLPPQAFIQALFLLATAIAASLALRPRARWSA